MPISVLKKFQNIEEIDGKWILVLRNRLRLSQERFARLLDVSNRTVARWEKDEAQPDPLLIKKLIGVGRITHELEKAGEPKEIAAWLEKPDPNLRGYPPVDLLGSGYGTEELIERIEEWRGGAG